MSFFKNLKDVATTAKNTASSTLSDASGRPGTLGKLASYGSRGLEGITRATDHVSGLINPDHRHDEAHEKQNDAVREQIRDQHRFRSFAGERDENFVKWHIDGHDYMWAVASLLDSAKQCIFILDWWLSPELYLRRPPAHNAEWRLDRILQRKASEGVKVYIIVYKEVTQTMNMSSKHTKSYLEACHENIAVMRHPDHIGSADNTQFWSHHEKVVVVDNHRACIGGLDLCFGRWDTHNHPLADVHPTDFSKTLFPGQDYNNARIQDFQKVDFYASNTVSILESGRMPWHDVHMTLAGPVVLDIVQHFVERWNEVKTRKYKSEMRYDWLALPHNVDAAPNEAVARHPSREVWQEKGQRFRQRFHKYRGDWTGHRRDDEDHDDDRDEQVYPKAPHGTCRVQVVRSASDWSHGIFPKETSVQDAYIQLIREANHYIYIENQFFISNTGPNQGPVENQIAGALAERIISAAKDGEKFKVVIVIPEVPGFAGQIADDSSLKTIMAAQYRTINRGGNSIYERVQKAGYNPLDYIKVYHLRSYDRLNAPLTSYIQKAEEASGVKFHNAQVALAKEWQADDPVNLPDQEKYQTTVQIAKPLAQQDGIEPDKKKQEWESIPLPATEEEARQIYHKFEEGAKAVRGDADVSDSVAHHCLKDRTDLLNEKWLGTEQEELDCYITELLYIHSKVMIVDDRRVIMGSANINDRSQKGNGDSEIALVVEDTDLLESKMNGKDYMANRFAATLRRKIYREHLGLIEPQHVPQNARETSFMLPAPIPNEDETGLQEDRFVADPLSDELLSHWDRTASSNTRIFTEVFKPVPANEVRTWDQYKAYVPKSKPGHVLAGVPLQTVKEKLNQVQGHLVEFPLDFLADQKDFIDNADWNGPAGLGLLPNPTLQIFI